MVPPIALTLLQVVSAHVPPLHPTMAKIARQDSVECLDKVARQGVAHKNEQATRVSDLGTRFVRLVPAQAVWAPPREKNRCKRAIALGANSITQRRERRR